METENLMNMANDRISTVEKNASDRWDSHITGKSDRTGTRQLTILHSNDIHGDFTPELIDGKEVGGLPLLSGYVMQCRQGGDNVLYVISGDMFRGSILDSDSNGGATIALVNIMAPDVVTLGNHEVDYGIEHLLFLEKCADFPIINANMKISQIVKEKRMFPPFLMTEIDGLRVLFIGLLTSDANEQIGLDPMMGNCITARDPEETLKELYETGTVPEADITVLLTHIGLNEDISLAKTLDPAWGINLIIGGHSHDLVEEPVVENGVTIVQAGTGSNCIGRFDLVYDFGENRIQSCRWQHVPIDSDTCKKDVLVEEVLNLGLTEAEKINGEVVTTLARELTHPTRMKETELGDLFADCFKITAQSDLALIASGSIRGERMGPVVTIGDYKTVFPYTDKGYLLYMTGGEMKKVLQYLFECAAVPGGISQLYQISEGSLIECDAQNGEIIRFEVNGKPVQDEEVYTVAVENYMYRNMDSRFGFTPEELIYHEQTKELASVADLVLDYLREHPGMDEQGTGRLILR